MDRIQSMTAERKPTIEEAFDHLMKKIHISFVRDGSGRAEVRMNLNIETNSIDKFIWDYKRTLDVMKNKQDSRKEYLRLKAIHEGVE